jgi:hypothetical protein
MFAMETNIKLKIQEKKIAIIWQSVAYKFEENV